MRLHTAFAVTLPNLIAASPPCARPASPRAAAAAAPKSPSPWSSPGCPPPPIFLEGVYFDDPDGHSLEYLAMLDDPPQPELGFIPLRLALPRPSADLTLALDNR